MSASSQPSNANAEQSRFEVVIVGAEFSGLLCATYLSEAGIADVRIFEMTPSVGGVWSKEGVGAYPGAACDVPSYMYLPFWTAPASSPRKDT